MGFAWFVLFFIAVGLLMGLGAQVLWCSSRRLMIATGALASVSGYVLTISVNAGHAFLVAFLASLATGVILAAIIAVVARRLAAEEFLLLALAVTEIVRRLALHFGQLTGGAYGLRFAGSYLVQANARFYLPGIIAILLAIALTLWYRRPGGLAWRVIGGAPLAAVLLGINPFRAEVAAGLLMGLSAALAGTAHVLGMRYIHPDDLGMSLSLSALALGLSARTRSLALDALCLSAVLFGLREILRLIEVGGTMRFAAHDLFLGVVIMAIAWQLRKRGRFT